MAIDRTTFNALIDSNGTPGHGSVWNKTAIAEVLLDPIDDALAAIGVAGSTTQVQFNDAGAMAGDAGLTYNKTTDLLTVGGLIAGTGGLTSGGAFVIGAAQNYSTDADANNLALTSTTGILVGDSASAPRTITGLTGGVAGRVVLFANRSGSSYLLTSEDGGSTDSNRFRTGNSATITVRTNGSAILFYYGSRWHVVSV